MAHLGHLVSMHLLSWLRLSSAILKIINGRRAHAVSGAVDHTRSQRPLTQDVRYLNSAVQLEVWHEGSLERMGAPAPPTHRNGDQHRTVAL